MLATIRTGPLRKVQAVKSIRNIRWMLCARIIASRAQVGSGRTCAAVCARRSGLQRLHLGAAQRALRCMASEGQGR